MKAITQEITEELLAVMDMYQKNRAAIDRPTDTGNRSA